MRLTAPAPDARADLDGVDLYDPAFYATGDPHLVWRTLRARCPVFWSAEPAPGFWLVTGYRDVRRVLRDHDSFSSERGIVVSSLGVPDPAAGMMVAVTDPPRHQRLRAPLGTPLTNHAVGGHAGWLRELVRETVAPAWDGADWDAAAAFARLSVASIVRLMGLPPGDVELLLGLAYASVAPLDPRFGTGPGVARNPRLELMSYLHRHVRRRRGAAGSDLLSHLLTVRVADRPMTDEEVVVNGYNVLLGAAVTTSQAIVATLLALAEQGDGRWPAGAPVSTAVEEALRWASPTMQFMRYARRDVVLRGVTVRAGDAVVASIGSANRDEEMFDRPYVFDPARRPNRHLAFGGGVHYCVGQGLARLTLQLVFEEFVTRVAGAQLAAAPVHLVSSLAAAVVSAPMRLRLRRP